MLFHLDSSDRDFLTAIGRQAAELHMPAYLVGGYVRDRLLGRPTKDLDIVCIGSGIDLAEKVASSLKPSPNVVVFRRFGTAMFRYDDRDIEFVGARKESYREDSRKPAVEEGSLEDDQFRRDFTINALAISLNEPDFGNLLDPFDGIRHLSEKRIVTPLDPGKTFSDDPLRMMRAIRFATQLGFAIDPETLTAIRKYRDRMHIVSQERIIGELNKILLEPKPSLGFKLLFDVGLLEIIFPELQALHGVEFKQNIGHKDNLFHTLEVLDNLARKSDNLWLRWAALLHDIAKPPTKKFEEGIGWTFHGHDALGAAMVPRIFRRMRLPMDHKMRFVQKMVRMHLRPISLTKEDITDSAVRRLLFDAGDDIDHLMLLCEADITSKNANKVNRYLENYQLLRGKLIEVEEKDRLRNWQPPISGEEIMATFGIGPSREVGILKNKIREAILDGDIDNNPKDAYTMLLQEGKKLGLLPTQDKSS